MSAGSSIHAFDESGGRTSSRSSRWFRGIEMLRGHAYAEGSRHGVDVCRPKSASGAPIVVFFYGGGWRSGRKELYRYVARALARRGYVAVLPDYRIYPQVRYPDFLEDGALAVRWAKNNARQFGGNPEQLFLMGHSAGAHIAAMLSLDGSWLGKVGLVPGRDIAGLIGLAGPYDFLPLRDEILATIFGGANRPETQPISYVAPGAPPALLLTGDRDDVVDAGNSTRLAERLRQAGNDAEAVVYPRMGHYLIIAVFAPLLRRFFPVLRDVGWFIDRIVRASVSSRQTRGAP
jgi:acetyl esterase/lipase